MELLTLDRGLKTNTAQVAMYRNKDLTEAFPAATFFSHDLTNKTFMVLKTNFPAEQICLTCPSVEGKPLHSYDLVCMFQYLFQASEQVQQKTEQYLQLLYPGVDVSRDSGFEYTAVHLRLGQMKGETALVNRISGWVDPLSKLLLSVSCGRGLAQQGGVDIIQTPLLLLADHKGIRRFSQHGKLSHVVAPSYEAVHTKLNSVEGHLLSFVDLNLIARAKCVVLSHSGFSMVGWWMSAGNDCRMLLSECYQQCAANTRLPICP